MLPMHHLVLHFVTAMAARLILTTTTCGGGELTADRRGHSHMRTVTSVTCFVCCFLCDTTRRARSDWCSGRTMNDDATTGAHITLYLFRSPFFFLFFLPLCPEKASNLNLLVLTVYIKIQVSNGLPIAFLDLTCMLAMGV